MTRSPTVNITIAAPPPPPPPKVIVTTISINASVTTLATGESTTISGQVLDQYGKPVSSLRVYLFVANAQQASTVTDGSGNYSFSVNFPSLGVFPVDVSDSVNNQ